MRLEQLIEELRELNALLKKNIIQTVITIANALGARDQYSEGHAQRVAIYSERLARKVELTEEELMTIAKRGINLEKAFNTIHAGFNRQDDYPPRRYMEEAIKSGPYAGSKCDREKWDEMLDRFYGLHGWDKATSWQIRQRLADLGMDDVADKLEKAGRLIK